MSSRRTGYAIIGAILVVSAAAFARAEQLKLQHSPVTAPRITTHFSGVCEKTRPACVDAATLSFKLRKPARVALTLVDASGHTVVAFTPAAGRQYPVGRVQVTWRGRTHSGARAPDGRYRLRVHLISLGRTITIPAPLIVDTVPPVLTLVSRPGSAPVRYRVNEPARVYLAFRPAGGGRGSVLGGHDGRVRIPAALRRSGGSMLMVAVDLAGNRSHAVSAGSLS
jgi:FlgD Ig-like domain